VYVFHRSGGTWQYLQRLEAATPTAFDDFGNSVALSGSWLAAAGRSGSVRVFHLFGSSFVPDASISVGAAQVFHVALAGSGLVVAGENDATLRRYTRGVFGGWTLRGTLVGPTNEAFGTALAMQGSRIIVGAPNSSVDGFQTGAGFLTSFSF